MRLSVLERLMLLNILPNEGDFTTLRIVRQLRESLSFNEEEHTLYDFKRAGEALEDGSIVPEGQLAWDRHVEQYRNFDLGKKATEIIVDRLNELDKAKKLRMDHYELCEKFLGDE